MTCLAIKLNQFHIFPKNLILLLTILQEAAASCSEGQWTVARQLGHYEEPDMTWFEKKKPDLIVCSSVNNPLSKKLLLHANKHLVPSIGQCG